MKPLTIETLKQAMYDFVEDGCTLSEHEGIRRFINYVDDKGYLNANTEERDGRKMVNYIEAGGNPALLEDTPCPECGGKGWNWKPSATAEYAKRTCPTCGGEK